MRRYYFDVIDRGELIQDEVGIDLRGDEEAANAAACVFAEVAHQAGAMRPARSLLFKVRAESGETILEVTVPFAADHPTDS